MMLKRFRSKEMLGGHEHKFKFKNRLLSLDATVITLCVSMFPWAKYQRIKGGIKLHVLLDNADYMPVFMSITDAKTFETRQTHLLKLAPGSIVVMDKAYTDYSLFRRWTEEGVFFVTRMKDNALHKVVSKGQVPQNGNILGDDVILLTGINALKHCQCHLRRIRIWDTEHERLLVFLTNNFDFAASTISDIYRERWQIEIFFKTLKQNLKIKTFVGTSENAVRIQIWTALIALLLLKWLHHLSKAGWSLSNLASLLRLNLFTYRNLLDWLNDPFNTPPAIPDSVQLKLPI
jgi:IS4 transposase